MTVCANMKIDSCPVEWFIAPKYDEILGLAEKGLSSVVVLPIGYRDEADKYSELKKVRFPTQEVLEII
jgi:nitroreductase